MTTTLNHVRERTRIPAPGPAPMALAYENGNFWVGSAKDWVVRGVRAGGGEVFAQSKAPEKPYGAVLVGGTLLVVVGDADDNRSIRSYTLGQTFTTTSIRCPNDTGNFLAHDGTSLYVSQRYDRLFVRVDSEGKSLQATPMPRQVVGVTYRDASFYVLTTDGSPADDDIRFARMTLGPDGPTITELARVPFGARSLAHDGTNFWTSWREKDLIVAFSPP